MEIGEIDCETVRMDAPFRRTFSGRGKVDASFLAAASKISANRPPPLYQSQANDRRPPCTLPRPCRTLRLMAIGSAR